MLQRISVRNFKLHRNTKIELKSITLLIGPNNSGKSSLFHILQLRKQAFTSQKSVLVPQMPEFSMFSQIFFPSDLSYLDVGTFHDVCTTGEDSITFALEGFFTPANLAMIKRKMTRIDVSYTATFQNNDLIYQGGEIAAREYSIKWEWDQYSGGRITSEPLHCNGFTIL
jgi:energy-coupling factor transporter ATP-binding protein EcfA2